MFIVLGCVCIGSLFLLQVPKKSKKKKYQKFFLNIRIFSQPNRLVTGYVEIAGSRFVDSADDSFNWRWGNASKIFFFSRPNWALQGEPTTEKI